MIVGTVRENDLEDEHIREEGYRIELHMFEGVPYTYHGITDELTHLSKLIGIIGESVLTQEKDFKIISQEAEAVESFFPTDKMIDNWYKKTYRSFSYKALLTVIHGVFEGGLKDLYNLLKESSRITFEIKNDQLLEVLKEFKALDKTLEPLILKVRPFNFIRNKIIHSDGYFTKSDKGYDEFEKFFKNRSDVEVRKLKSLKGKFTHRIFIKNSTLLKDYINLITDVFATLTKAAHEAEFIKTTNS